MDELLKLFGSMTHQPTGGPAQPDQIPKELESMQSKLKNMNSKLMEKLNRTKVKLLKAKDLPKNTVTLLIAASVGDNSKCHQLLSTGTDANSRGVSNETALCVAATGGHTDLLKLLLQHNADANAQDEDGDTPLILAVMADKTAFVRALLEHCGSRVDVNVKNKEGKTAIERAFKAGNEEAVTLLAERRAHFDCNEEKHKNILFKYALEGKVSFIRFWLNQHPRRKDVVDMTRKSRTLALVASLNGNLSVVELLSAEGANLDLPDEDGDTPLFCAAQNGFYSIVDFLVRKDCNVNHRNKAGRTPIFSALINGHFDIVRYLHDHDASLTVTDRKGNSLLNVAIVAGSTESFDFLCKHLPEDCLQFNAVTKDGETCLLEASQTTNLTIFKVILEKSIDLNHKNKQGVSAVLRAAFNDQLEMVQLLLNRGAEPDLPSNGNETALLCAAQRDNLQLVRLLINTGKCRIAVEDCNGFTLAYRAVENKNIEMLRILVNLEAPLDIADISGNTPLILAVNQDCIEAVKILVEEGKVDLSRRNLKGHTAALLAVNNESEEMLKYLLDQGCERDVCDKSGDTPLLLSIKKKNYKIAKLLLSGEGLGCDTNIADRTGKSCLHVAALTRNSAFITLLSGRGANLDKKNSESNTPFAISANNENSTELTVLEAKGADVNRRNAEGQNAVHLCISHGLNNLVALEALGCSLVAEDVKGNAPIHVAAASGESLAMEFLIEQGVPIDLPNKDGDTPVHLACKKGSSDALKCLLEHNATLKLQNNLKQTELMLASKSGDDASIDILLKHYGREEIDLQDTDGKTALHHAIESKHDGAATRLIEADADVNVPDHDGLTPGLYAAKTSQWSVLNCAIQGHIDFERKTRNAKSVAHFAASGADLETLRKLKEMNASLTDLTLEGDSCLTLAASKGSVQVCEFLIAEENRIDHCNIKGENAICKAAQGSHAELFFYLACIGADFLRKDQAGTSSLYYFLDGAETLDHSAISELLKEVGEQELVDLNSQGFGLCHLAAKKGCGKLLRSLRDRSWNLTRTTASGETCITLAARASDSETLEFLFQSQVAQLTALSEQEARSHQDQMKPELVRALHIRAKLGKTDLMSELLSSGIDVNATDEEGNTALMIACQHKQQDFATSLLSKEVVPPVDVDRVNHKGFSAIHYASKNQLTDCVKQLLSCRAKTDAVNSEGYTCLHEAVRGADSTDVAELLINSGCDVNTKTNDGNNSLMLALKNGSRHLTYFLKRRGATVDVDKMPLALVVKRFLSRGRRDVVTWLLEQGADVNKVDTDSRHVLFDVIDHGAEEILNTFMDKGANIECEEDRGFTPFLYAILVGREDLAKILLDRGCSTDKRVSSGFDCVMIAVSARRLYTLKWLFENVPELSRRPQAEVKGQTALHLCGETGHHPI